MKYFSIRALNPFMARNLTLVIINGSTLWSVCFVVYVGTVSSLLVPRKEMRAAVPSSKRTFLYTHYFGILI